jgi:hypothetical protein
MHYLHYGLISVDLVNMLILSALIYIYAKNYRHIKSKYTLGLMIFSALFLVHIFMAMVMGVYTWIDVSDDTIMVWLLITELIQMLGLAALLYITWD